MMKMLIPAVGAIIIGVGGGAGYAFMASSPPLPIIAQADSSAANDSLASTAAHESNSGHDSALVVGEHGEDDASATAHGAADTPLTPADSIRELEKARLAMHEPKPTAAAEEAKAVAAAEAGATTAAQSIKAASSNASQTALPELRLAKIFGAMQSKDAARVLEQMTDADVRFILALMSDRQAAAILTSFPAARAATITRGSIPRGGTP